MNVLGRIVVCALLTVLAVMADPPWRPAHAGGPTQVFTITPCRALDTRFAGGLVRNGVPRSFSVVGNLVNQGGQATCGVPSDAQAVFLNIVSVAPTSAGYLTIYAFPGPAPVASTLNFGAGQNVANGALTPICTQGSTVCTSDLMVTVSQASANVVVDVTGYTMAATAASGGGGSTCTPITCASAGATCGTIANGCGGTLTCGGSCVVEDPNAFSWFKIVAPTWKASQGPMPIQIGAMIDDRFPQLNYTGTCTVGLMSPLFGTILQVYDQNMQPVPNLSTTPFVNGGWNGYVWLKTGTGKTQTIGLSCFDSKIGVGGNSNAFDWIVP